MSIPNTLDIEFDPVGAEPGIEDRLREVIAKRCVFRKDDRRIISMKGGSLGWIMDLRQAFMDADALDMISTLFWQRFKDITPVQVGGMEVAAVPLVTAIILKARSLGIDATGFLIRKERKTTGLGNIIEGTLTAAPIILVDDVINSGNSLEKSRVVLAAQGHKVASVFTVVDYKSKKGAAWRAKTRIAVTALFSLIDFDLKLKSGNPPLARFYEPAWQFTAQDGHPFSVVPKSSPLLLNGRLYFGTDKGRFYALDARDGEPLWHFDALKTGRKGIWSTPCHDRGRIYFGAYDGNVYCLDAASGAEIWTNHACEWVGSSPIACPDHNLLVLGLEYERPRAQGSVTALSLDTGEKVWERWLRVYQHGSAAYWAASGLVVFGTNDHTVEAYHIASGEPAWSFATRRSVKYAPRIDAERGLVCFASFDGSIYVLDVATGEMRAEFPTGNICYTTPLVAGNRLFCGSGDKHLYVVDLDTLTLEKAIHCGARVYSSPRLIDGKVVFGTNGGVMFELDPVSLEIEGVLQVPDAITNSIAGSPDGRTIYVPTYMNEIYAFERR